MRILIASLGSPGFLYPQVGLARALRERGHEIGFVTDLSLQPFLEREGFRRLPRGLRDGPSFQVSGWAETASVILQIKHLEHAIEVFRPGLLIGQQLTYGPLLVAARKGLPVALMGQCVYLWQQAAAADDLDRFTGVEKLRVARYRSWFQLHNLLRRQYHLPELTIAEQDLLHGDLFLLRGVPEWHIDSVALPPRVHLAGACLWEPEERAPGLDAWLQRQASSGRPVLYVQHGRAFHLRSFWEALKNALHGTGVAVVASVDRMDREVGALPENFFVRPHIPQQQVLGVASGVISNANTTVTLGALEAGLPSLVLPGGGEQPDIAERCAQLGLARVLSLDDVDEDSLRAGIGHLVNDPELRGRAAGFKEAFARMPRFDRPIELLEQLIVRGGPVLRAA